MGGFGTEQVWSWRLSCLWKASQGIRHLLRAGPVARPDLPRAATGADEVTSLAQSPGQRGEQGLTRARAAWLGWEARRELCTARDAPALQQGEPKPLRIAAGRWALSVHGSRAAQNPRAWWQAAQQPSARDITIALGAARQDHGLAVPCGSRTATAPCPSYPPRFDATSWSRKAVGDRREQPSPGTSRAPWSSAPAA